VVDDYLRMTYIGNVMETVETGIMAKKPQVGRPPIPAALHQVQVPLRLSADLIKRIDAARADNLEAPTRSGFIKQLIIRGLDDWERKRK
jgi:hypothetical protein